MIPTGSTIESDALEEAIQPSRTYGLDITNGRISGSVDGLDAVRQVVLKILKTERFEHFIYSFDFGSEISGLSGRSPEIIKSELVRRVREALMQDDRISDITDMKITVSGDSALVTFTVISEFGTFREGVTTNV